MPEQGDIVLIPIPFTDLSSQTAPTGDCCFQQLIQPQDSRHGRSGDDFKSASNGLQLHNHLGRFNAGHSEPARQGASG